MKIGSWHRRRRKIPCSCPNSARSKPHSENEKMGTQWSLWRKKPENIVINFWIYRSIESEKNFMSSNWRIYRTLVKITSFYNSIFSLKQKWNYIPIFSECSESSLWSVHPWGTGWNIIIMTRNNLNMILSSCENFTQFSF